MDETLSHLQAMKKNPRINQIVNTSFTLKFLKFILKYIEIQLIHCISLRCTTR